MHITYDTLNHPSRRTIVDSMKRRVAWVVVGSVLVLSGSVSAVTPSCDAQSAFCFSRSAYKTPKAIQAVETPQIAVPLWKVRGE